MNGKNRDRQRANLKRLNISDSSSRFITEFSGSNNEGDLIPTVNGCFGDRRYVGEEDDGFSGGSPCSGIGPTQWAKPTQVRQVAYGRAPSCLVLHNV